MYTAQHAWNPALFGSLQFKEHSQVAPLLYRRLALPAKPAGAD
jgi:hypothetical protein